MTTFDVLTSRADVDAGMTAQLAAWQHAVDFAQLPADIVHSARLCLLDWFAVTVLGAHEPLAQILADEAAERGAAGAATLVGRCEQVGLADAALINGAASHALDYDDCSEAISGHVTVGIAAALLAQAEFARANGRAVIAAFVGAYELAARCGLLVAPDHYGRGFHPTATIGTIAAAAACAKLLGLDAAGIEQAMGIAATQAAGLIVSFGTMCKPLHVGRAAANGLLAARLAARGFTARAGIVEMPRGFARAHGDVFHAERALAPAPKGYHLRDNFFKFHAACGGTHAFVEAARLLREREGVRPDDIAAITLRVHPGLEKVCDIPAPTTGLEIKFSLRTMAALGFLDRDTAAPGAYTAALARDAEVQALRQRMCVEYTTEVLSMAPEIIVELRDGRRCAQRFHAGRPEPDLDLSQDRLSAKFFTLTRPVLGAERAEQLHAAILDLENLNDVGALLRLATQ